MAGSGLPRRVLLAMPPLLGVAACTGGREPPLTSPGTNFPALSYEYLTPIRLKVATVDVENQFVPSPGDLGRFSPAPPDAVLAQMGRTRLGAFGAEGRAAFVILDASLTRAGDSYFGNFAVELDVYTGADRAGFAQARVTRSRTIDPTTPRDAALYALTRDLMDGMNVEFEYQVRQSLRDWIATVPDATAPQIEQQELAPPPPS
ncbi:MAG: hypothetical protein JOZ42_15670 [Acetobacteraceae bacterium]|nr:hypothetical protein [Acetobacteraceae bacterium]